MSKEMWNFEIEVLISSFSDKWIIRNYGENKNFVINIKKFHESYVYIFLYIFIVIFLNIFTKWIIYKMYKHSM